MVLLNIEPTNIYRYAQPVELTTHALMLRPVESHEGFDPTCGILAAGLHVRVAVAREPAQATPISGSYLGDASVFRGLEVTVKAHALPANP